MTKNTKLIIGGITAILLISYAQRESEKHSITKKIKKGLKFVFLPHKLNSIQPFNYPTDKAIFAPFEDTYSKQEPIFKPFDMAQPEIDEGYYFQF